MLPLKSLKGMKMKGIKVFVGLMLTLVMNMANAVFIYVQPPIIHASSNGSDAVSGWWFAGICLIAVCVVGLAFWITFFKSKTDD